MKLIHALFNKNFDPTLINSPPLATKRGAFPNIFEIFELGIELNIFL